MLNISIYLRRVHNDNDDRDDAVRESVEITSTQFDEATQNEDVHHDHHAPPSRCLHV